jgi:cation transport ATPase
VQGGSQETPPVSPRSPPSSPNWFWAFVYNVVGFPLAAAGCSPASPARHGYFNARVVTNGFRIRRVRCRILS